MVRTAMAEAQKTRSIAKRNALVLSHLKMVRAIAHDIRKMLPASAELDDLIDTGVVGLIDAVDRFDPAKNVPFPCYARFRVRGAILDSLRRIDPVSRHFRRQEKLIERAFEDLIAKLGRAPTEEEIAERAGFTVEDLREIYCALRFAQNPLSLSSPHDDLPVPDVPAPASEQPEAICGEVERDRVLADALGVLPPRYRTIVELYYRDELKMREIGQRMGINESRVSQILRDSMSKLRQTMTERGINSRSALSAAA